MTASDIGMHLPHHCESEKTMNTIETDGYANQRTPNSRRHQNRGDKSFITL